MNNVKNRYKSIPLPFIDLPEPVLSVYFKKKLKDLSILEISPDGEVILNEVPIIRIWYMLTGIELTDKEGVAARIILEEDADCVDTVLRDTLCERIGIDKYNLGNVLSRLRKKKFITDNNCLHPILTMLKNKSISTITIKV